MLQQGAELLGTNWFSITQMSHLLASTGSSKVHVHVVSMHVCRCYNIHIQHVTMYAHV